MYITTHLSAQHVRAFNHCWPLSRKSAPQIHLQSDVMLFSTGGANHSVPAHVMSLWTSNQSVRVILRDNPGYQEGANLAMAEAVANKTIKSWFATYDWVIRLNADAIIRNDTQLLAFMHDPDVDGIFADCWVRTCKRQCTKAKLNTDFFAVRPHALPESWPIISNAELAFTKAMENTVRKGKDRWLMNKAGTPGRCRTQGDVEHNHGFVEDCVWLNTTLFLSK